MFILLFDDVQKVRLLDVFVVAPIMVYAGASKSNLPIWVKTALISIGVATFIYNGNNYLKNRNQNG